MQTFFVIAHGTRSHNPIVTAAMFFSLLHIAHAIITPYPIAIPSAQDGGEQHAHAEETQVRYLQRPRHRSRGG